MASLLSKAAQTSATDLDSSIYWSEALQNLAEINKDTLFLGKAYAMLGSLYTRSANHDAALRTFQKQLSIAQAKGDSLTITFVYHNLGKSLEWQGQYDQAYSYYLKARENLPPRPHTSLHGVLTNSLGNIHSLINQTIDSAEYYYNASVQIRKEIQDTASLAYVTHDWALLKMGQQEVDTALIMLREARQGFIQTQQLWAAAQAANSFGLAYINKENHDSAIYWNQICIQESEATGNTVALLGALRNLNYSHHIAGQFEKAAEAQDRIIQYQDSVYGNRTNTEIERLEAQLALEAQERTNAVLKQQQALQEAKLARQQLYLFVSGLALFALAGLIYSLSKTRQRQQAFNHTLQVANQEINKQNQDIKDSLAYAQHLQQALLPTPQALSMVLGEFALFYRPLGFVSGDFYWAEELPDGSKLIATIDCTGHGVPGAMLSVLAHSGLQSAVRSGKQEPADLLFHLHTYLRNNLQDQTQDGLAIGLCRIYSDTNRLSFAGAGHNLVAIQRNEMQIMPAIRSSLGSRQWLKNDIIQHEIAGVDHRDTFFLFSDGFQDQFGGPNGRKYYPKQLREWLYQHYHLPMTQLEAQLATEFDSWKGNLDQIDDVLVLGFRPWPRNPKVKQT